MNTAKKIFSKDKIVVIASLIALVLVLGIWLTQKKPAKQEAARTESNLFSMGQVAANSGKHDLAVSLYQELLSKDPKHSIALRFMLESQMRLNDKEGILKSIEKLLSLDPSEQNMEVAASAYLQVGEKEKAEVLLKSLKNKTTSDK